jgi:hypothetical protein
MSRFSSAKEKLLFFEIIGPLNSKPYRRLPAGVAVTENGSVALKIPSLSVKKAAPWNLSAPGLVVISMSPPKKGGYLYRAEKRSGLMRIEAIEFFGGRALGF